MKRIMLYLATSLAIIAEWGLSILAGPDKMIIALNCLAATSTTAVQDQLNALGISGGKGGICESFMTHPRIEDRIKALQQPK